RLRQPIQFASFTSCPILRHVLYFTIYILFQLLLTFLLDRLNTILLAEYVSTISGSLVTSGNVIASITKKLLQGSGPDVKQSDEEFFARVDQKEMTPKDRDHYCRVVVEYSQTECSHIHGLELLIDVYLEPMYKESKKVLKKEDSEFITVVITQVKTLIEVHKNFLEMFQQGLLKTKAGELPTFGIEFVKSLQFLKMASQYIGNYNTYVTRLTKILEADPIFEKVIKKAKEKYVTGENLENLSVDAIQPMSFYLITPIQRIPRYELLIRDMLKDVGKDFPDLENLKNAYLQAKESGRGVNTTRMQIEENEKFQLVRDLIKGELVIKDQAARKFIMAGSIYFVENVNTPPVTLLYVFLFNDVMLETLPTTVDGVVVDWNNPESVKTAYTSLNSKRDVKELSKCSFDLVRELPFTLGQCVFKPIHDTSEVKNMFSILLREYKTIRGVAKDFPTLGKYSALTQEDKEVWESVIYDQFRYIDDSIENKEKLLKNKDENLASELSRIQNSKQRSFSVTSGSGISSNSSQSTGSGQQLSDGSSVVSSESCSTTIVGVTKPVTTTVPLITPTEVQKPPKPFSIQHITSNPGSLITSGNVIAVVTKYLSDWENTEKSSNDNDFFKAIDERMMGEKEKAHYRRVFHEMTETERIHLNGLKILKEVYLTPITKSSVQDTVTFVKPIVSQIDLLLTTHQKFLEMMEKAEHVSEGEFPIIGADFVKNIQFLKMAATYISKYSTYLMGITDILNKEKDVVRNQNKAKAEYLKVHEGSKVEMISFYLITPIQRIPRYELLIRDMLKDVGKDFPDVEQLKKAYLQAKECGRGVNQTRMQIEEGEKMTLVKNAIDNFPQLENVSSRKFICCGPLLSVMNMKDFPSNMVFVFLFNDLLIETKVVKYNKVEMKNESTYDPVLFKELSEIKAIEDINVAHFEFNSIFFLRPNSKVMAQNDSMMVKNVFMFMAFEEIEKNGVKSETHTCPKYSAISEDQKEAWKSVINDQIACMKEKEEKLKKTQEKIQNISELPIVEKVSTKVFDRSCAKFSTPRVGTLVTSAGPISTVLKALQDGINNSEQEVKHLFESVAKKEMNKDDEKRYMAVLRDLRHLETSHLWALKTLKEVYLVPMSKSVSKEQMSNVNDCIAQVEIMLNIHGDFLKTFNKAKHRTAEGKVPQIMAEFMKNIQFLKMESTYITNFNVYKRLFNEYMKESVVQKMIQKAKDDFFKQMKDKMPIESFEFCLQQPLTQTPRYENFLKAMLKHVGKNFEELGELKKTYLDAQECTRDAVIMKSQLEENEKTVTIRDLIIGTFSNDVISTRKYLCSGPLFVVEKLTEVPQNWMYFFLFNDRLVETEVLSYDGKPIKDKLDAFGKLRVAKMIEDLKVFKYKIVKEFIFNPETTLEVHPSNTQCKFVILLKISQIPFRFSCSTESECDAWNSIIFDQIEKMKEVVKTKEQAKSSAVSFELQMNSPRKFTELQPQTIESSQRVSSESSPRRAQSLEPEKINTDQKFVARTPRNNKTNEKLPGSPLARRNRRVNEDEKMQELFKLQQENSHK
ncbi:rho guanine nucleotide exchange factor, putative, partial [Entamoeba invadens IP1]